MPVKSKPTSRKAATTRKKRGAKLSYAQLLRIAPKLKPPQKWFDEDTNPFEPKRSR